MCPESFPLSFPISFAEAPTVATPWHLTHDLRIYYDSLTGSDVITGWCSRWDSDNYSIITETWLKKNDLQTLRDNIRPGATKELYRILGRPRYYDSSWTGDNTLKFSPHPSSQLHNMRSDTLGFVRSITDTPLPGDSRWLSVKIESYISGMGDL